MLSCGVSNQIRGIKSLLLLFSERSPSICLILLHFCAVKRGVQNTFGLDVVSQRNGVTVLVLNKHNKSFKCMQTTKWCGVLLVCLIIVGQNEHSVIVYSASCLSSKPAVFLFYFILFFIFHCNNLKCTKMNYTTAIFIRGNIPQYYYY